MWPYQGKLPDNAEELGEDYLQTARDLARRQAVLAGYRLADRLHHLKK